MIIRIDQIKKLTTRTLLLLAALISLFLILNLLFPLPDQIEYSTIITDNKNEIIHAYLTSDQKWRMKTEAADISPLLRKTLIEKEDRYFYYHPGINIFSMSRALVKNIFTLRRTSGASTITMQVAKALEPKKRTYLNKLIEMFRALQLECKYSKEQILEMYVNLVPYGGNIEGVKAASLLYFKKSPNHLSLAEITVLCIIPNRPSSLVIGKNNALIVSERNRWLRRFQASNVFTAKQIKDALEEPLEATRGNTPQYIPHLAWKLKKEGSPIIKTNIDLNTQQKVEKLVWDHVHNLYHNNIRNAAVIIVDNTTNAIITYVGSADFTDTIDGGQVNGAAAIRQPGSTLKPFLYGLGIDAGLMTPKMVMTDVPVNYEGYAPENFDKKFNGYVTMEYALEHSLNIPAVNSLKLVGKDKFIQRLASCNFKQVRKDQLKLGLSMILGGCGTTLEELTGLYASFAHEGLYSRPAFLQSDTVKYKKRILSAASAFMINETLSKINRPDFPVNWQATEHMPKIAWKTGTSYGRRDAWSIGYNKKYTVGIWIGNFSGLGIPELSGANSATPLLFKIFNTIDYNGDEQWFQQPKECDSRIVCSETGLVPGDHCKNLVMDYFIPLVSSTKKCDNIKEVLVSADESISYCKTCLPANGYKKKMLRIIAPDMQAFFKDQGIAYDKVPPHNPACEKIFREGSPLIVFPSHNAEYLISKKNPEPLQLSCRVNSDVSKVYWYINNKFYKSSASGSKQFFIPEEGPIKISCTDDKGRNKDIWITVRYVEL